MSERFWSKVDRSGGPDACWPWTAAIMSNGYGSFKIPPGGQVVAHRLAYEMLVGPIPEGLQIDHLCRVRHCVNPAHMEPVTQRENVLRGVGATAQNARKTHCLHGHPLSGDNLHVISNGRWRQCRTCRRASQRRWREKQRMAA